MKAEPFQARIDEATRADLRERLGRTRWISQPDGHGWDLGVDAAYLRRLCAHWADGYDFGRLEARLADPGSFRWQGMHFLHQPGDALPIMLLHGWPGAVLEYDEVVPRLAEAGHEVAVPSMPGYGFSEDPGEPLNIAAVAERFRALAADGLGWERYAVAGGDWGAPVAARMAADAPDAVAALHVFTPGTLPPAAELADPPPSEAEQAFIEEGMRWRRREGHHLSIQGRVPDIVAAGLNDSPAGLAAYLLDKYRRWSDCGGDVESRFSRDELCDYLTLYWATGTIASSMRLYYGEARERWKPGPGETIEVPAGVAVFPAEIINPPREWSERLFADLRRWEEMPRGGHFAAHEEPELLSAEILALLSQL